MQETVREPSRLTRLEVLGYIAVLIVSTIVRTVALDRIPPGLWYDEAIYALDGLSVANGHFPIFFETYGHMREPLYIYSLGGFFALFGHSTYNARLVSALWGIATVAVFFPVARRFFGNRWGLVAMLLLGTFRWHIHFSRTIFRAVLPPLFILSTLWFFLRWRQHRRPADAVYCGAILGAGMYTYLSFRLVPLLLLLWMGWLFFRKELIWKRDRNALGLLVAAASVVFLPLGLDYLKHPQHFTGRTSEISMFFKNVPDSNNGSVRRVAKPLPEIVSSVAGNVRDVALMWTVRGDHVGKHNLPNEPVFDWLSGSVFYIGMFWSLACFVRSESAVLPVVWIAVMSLTSILSFGAPNLLRMQGATPAAILVYVSGLRFLHNWSSRFLGKTARQIITGGLVLLFCLVQLPTYFIRFPKSTNVRQEFLTEMFYEPAEVIKDVATKGRTVYIPAEMADTPTCRFVTAEINNIVSYMPDTNLPGEIKLPAAVLVTMRSLQLAGQAGQDPLAWLVKTDTASRMHRFYLTEPDDNATARKQLWAELWFIK